MQRPAIAGVYAGYCKTIFLVTNYLMTSCTGIICLGRGSQAPIYHLESNFGPASILVGRRPNLVIIYENASMRGIAVLDNGNIEDIR